MKTMKDFSAFKLNKNQMGAMKGGELLILAQCIGTMVIPLLTKLQRIWI